MIRAVIFDCFGVLAEDGWLPFKRRYIGQDARLAQEVADIGKQNEFGMLDSNSYIQQVAALVGVEEQILRNAISMQAPNDELFSYISDRLKPEYKIGLLSNANFNVVEKLFTQKQGKLFDTTVLSYETRLIKPDPRMFELIAKRLGVALEECIFIDDIERYCTAAGLLGMYSILYESPQQCIDEVEKIIA